MKGLLNVILLSVLVSLVMGLNSTQKTINYDNKQYFIEPENKYNWFQAQAECTLKNMSLLTVDTVRKAITIHKLMIEVFKCQPVPKMYIGAYDMGDYRKFMWIATGREVTLDNWLKFEPNNYEKRNERCVHMGHRGSELWNDINCQSEYGFICESDDIDSPQTQKIEKDKINQNVIKLLQAQKDQKDKINQNDMKLITPANN